MNLDRAWLIVPSLMLSGAAGAQTVTTGGLLKQMTDLDWLTQRPKPYFSAAQASSYDRASKTPADPKTWFANGDAGQYVRIEERDGRKEYVLADLKGPGTVVRFWSANPAGVTRFYFDGETTPRLQASTADLLNGKVSPFTDPFSYSSAIASNGCNLYFPFPYAKSLKITTDNSGEDGARHMYYHVGFRTYQPGTKVETFDPAQLPSLEKAMSAVRVALATSRKADGKTITKSTSEPHSKGFRQILNSRNGSVLESLQVKIPFPLVVNIRKMDWNDINQPHNVLRNTILTIQCDGETTVKVPLGDFFGTAAGVNPYRSYPMAVEKDGTMVSLFPMPFHKQMIISIDTPKGQRVPLQVVTKVADRRFTPDTYYFHAHWNVDIGSTRPMRDMEFLNTKGEGLWVGTSLHVSNPTPAWWGEGDEKAWVDGESFPSTFGTGTEDYFGYAWSSGKLFDRPYHGQNHCDGPGTFGQINVHRWQTFDPISYAKSIKFDIEMWHWQDVQARFARVSYWYAKPGSKTIEMAMTSKNLELVEVAPPSPVKGATEGEGLKYEKTGSGEVSVQEGFWEPSGGKQLWWIQSAPGDKLLVHVPVKQAGTYEIVGSFCHARDYGIHSLRFLTPDGKELGAPKTLDFYNNGVIWKKIPLGTFELPAGEVILEVVCKGHNPQAIEGNMFGLDYLMLTKKG